MPSIPYKINEGNVMIKSMNIALLAVCFLFTGCDNSENQEESVKKDREPLSAICILHPTEGNNVKGMITFKQTDEGILVTANVEGLTPGLHGFHIHQYGDCSAPDGTSTGGHFNPTNKKHGSPNAEERHVGDLGNLVAGEDGTAHYEWTDNLISFTGPNSILGRAIIVHAGEDDLVSQPTGTAGARVACGVIGLAK